MYYNPYTLAQRTHRQLRGEMPFTSLPPDGTEVIGAWRFVHDETMLPAPDEYLKDLGVVHENGQYIHRWKAEKKPQEELNRAEKKIREQKERGIWDKLSLEIQTREREILNTPMATEFLKILDQYRDIKERAGMLDDDDIRDSIDYITHIKWCASKIITAQGEVRCLD